MINKYYRLYKTLEPKKTSCFKRHPVKAENRRLPELVLAAAGLPEVSDGGELGVDGAPVEPAVVEGVHCLLGVLFRVELHDTGPATATAARANST